MTELDELSRRASQGRWEAVSGNMYGEVAILNDDGSAPADDPGDDSDFICALVNAYREGRLVER